MLDNDYVRPNYIHSRLAFFLHDDDHDDDDDDGDGDGDGDGEGDEGSRLLSG